MPLCDLPFKSVFFINRKKDFPLFMPCEAITKNNESHCPIQKIPNPLEWQSDDSELNPEQIINSLNYQTLQDNHRKGIKDKRCKFCWDLEKTGPHSPRLNPDKIDKDTDGLMVHFLLDNKCNMACRMCSPMASSLLQKDFNYFKHHENVNDITSVTDGFFSSDDIVSSVELSQWDWVINNIHKIGALKVTGGEPLFNKQFINAMIPLKKDGLNLNVTTNGSLFTNKMCDILNEFKGLYFTISLDSIGKNYEYVRYPYNFKKVEKSIANFIKRCYNIKEIKYNCVVSALNIFYIDELIKWNNDSFNIYFTEVYPNLRGIGIKNLPVFLLKELYDIILNVEFSDHMLLNMIQKAIDDNQEDKQKMIKEIKLFDSSRNQNFRDYLHPNLLSWLDG
ncbi:MAG: hypothetical protein CL432_09310 [Acidimicrobiaceae bacterium]|nr:hypothetical protein [Acidimicrobiaceae bacterium]